MTEELIREYFERGNTGEYSHLLICCDTYDYEMFPVYVKHGENVEEKIDHYRDPWGKMTNVEDIYDYSLNLEEQLKHKCVKNVRLLLNKTNKQ